MQDKRHSNDRHKTGTKDQTVKQKENQIFTHQLVFNTPARGWWELLITAHS